MVDQVLSISNSKGCGTEGNPKLSIEFRETIENNYARIKKAQGDEEKQKNTFKQKLQWLAASFCHFRQAWIEVDVNQLNQVG